MAVHTPWLVDTMRDYLQGQVVKAMLVDSSYAESPVSEFRTIAAAAEVSGAGYVAGGIVLTGLAVTYDETGVIYVNCDDVAFGEVDLDDVKAIVFYVATGDPDTDPVLAADVFPEAFDTVDSDEFTYQPSFNGIFVMAPF